MRTQMQQEMAEQPALLRKLVDRFDDDVAAVRSLVVEPPTAVVLVGRGSSDNAATLGRYAIEMATGKPTGMAAPSLVTRYAVPSDYRGALVVALSQSGRTPEITTTLTALAGAGARTVAITNDDHSPLGRCADLTLPLHVGAELAIPATKTVTAQMLVLLAVASGLGTLPLARSALVGLPDVAASILADDQCALRVADRWRAVDHLLVVARGLLLAAAFETALKVRETAGVTAIGTSSADLLHGPIAALAPGAPVLVIDADPTTAADLARLGERLADIGVDVLRMGTRPADALPVPRVDALLAPIVATLRGQQLAVAMAQSRGLDPDLAGGLSKVTLTA